jgi:hypothetical protein
MFDHVEAGRFLEQPARKDLAPGQRLIGSLALFNENLHKGPGLLRLLPWQRAFAAIKLDHNIADPARFARLHHQILADIVALIEQADSCHPVFHRSAVLAFNYRRSAFLRGNLLGDASGGGLRITLTLAPGKRQRGKAKQSDQARHNQTSGVQDW